MTVPKRFGVLRFFAALLRVVAWVVLILGIIFAILAALGNYTNLLSTDALPAIPFVGPFLTLLGTTAGGIAAGISVALSALIVFLVYYALAESLSLQLALEENTRLTAALLLRMHQESQPDPRAAAAYGPTYASEPFEG